MKTLIVYAKDSVFKFPRLFEEFVYEVSESNQGLYVWKRNPSDGEESQHAVFMNWDYYLIEDEEE